MNVVVTKSNVYVWLVGPRCGNGYQQFFNLYYKFILTDVQRVTNGSQETFWSRPFGPPPPGFDGHGSGRATRRPASLGDKGARHKR